PRDPGSSPGGGRGGLLDALQAADQRAQEYPVEAQLAGGGDLLEKGGADLEHRHRARGADGGGPLGAGHIARLAEAVAGVEGADAPPVPLDRAAARDQDVEAIVHLAFLDDLLALRVVLPAARPQHLPDLRMGELVEELEATQDAELLLPVDARVGLAQPLMYAGQLRGEVDSALVPLRRV